MAPRFDLRERWYVRLSAQRGYEVWLLSWMPGQGTELHDHGGSAGAFTVVRGLLTEATVVYPRSSLPRRALRCYPPVRAFGRRHIHRVVNLGTEPAVSVHVYAPAITSMTRYRLDPDGLRMVGVQSAGEDW